MKNMIIVHCCIHAYTHRCVVHSCMNMYPVVKKSFMLMHEDMCIVFYIMNVCVFTSYYIHVCIVPMICIAP